MNYRLELHQFCLDGIVTDIKEGKNDGMIKERTLSFNYFDSKQFCNAKVQFVTDKEEVDLFKHAVRFVKRLRHVKNNPRYS